MTKNYEHYLKMINAALEKMFVSAGELPQRQLAAAMRYSLLAGGKRLRPVLVLMFCEAAGGNTQGALPIACAVEMLHTYSLIHDDLPCMDNDELRRGKPTNHMVFGECTATLAGDALQAEAFGAILRSGLLPQVCANCAEALADAAGLDGICGGQQVDMESDSRPLSEEELNFVHNGKTASLIICACKMGALAANATEKQLEAACLYGAALGRAFQIRDDMLDVLSSEGELGKTVGTDKREGKTTSMTLYGEAGCRGLIEKLTATAKEAVRNAFESPDELCALADMLEIRSK